MTEEQNELYIKTKDRLRRLGKENPADCILGLALEIEAYRSKIRAMEELLDKLSTINKLYEGDNSDLQKQLEKKVEEVYPEFMRDYQCMREELDGAYDELEELRKQLTNKKGLILTIDGTTGYFPREFLIEAIRTHLSVIRCKDCQWWTKQPDSVNGKCALLRHYPMGDWQCAIGKRRDE